MLAILTMLARDGARCAWLRVALLLPSPALRSAAWALPGRDGKAGSPIEPESRIGEVAARTFSAVSTVAHSSPVGSTHLRTSTPQPQRHPR